jgi:hypothetical protein
MELSAAGGAAWECVDPERWRYVMAGKAPPPSGKEPELGENGLEDEVALNPRIQEELGKALRTFSQDIVNQPIPDRFLALLAQLEAKEREGK